MNQDEFFQDDFFKNANAGFNHLNPMMDLLENSMEQPPLPGDWRFQDKTQRTLGLVEMDTELSSILSPENLAWARNYGKELSNSLSMLESDIEGTAIPPPVQAADIPPFEPTKPGGLKSPGPPIPQTDWRGFPNYNPPGFGKIRSSRGGVRSQSNIFCEKEGERKEHSECIEGGCEHWDSEIQICRYGEKEEIETAQE